MTLPSRGVLLVALCAACSSTVYAQVHDATNATKASEDRAPADGAPADGAPADGAPADGAPAQKGSSAAASPTASATRTALNPLPAAGEGLGERHNNDVRAPSSRKTRPNTNAQPTAKDQRVAGEKFLYDGSDSFKAYNGAISRFKAAIGLDPPAPAKAVLHARMAEAMFRKGDLAQKDASKMKLYKLGQKAAEAGLAIDNDCVPCLFWRTSNLGRWGQTRGILKSLFLLPDVRNGYERCLKLDPQYSDCILALAVMDTMVPGFAGGDTDRAKKNFERLLAVTPNHTRGMVDLAVLLEDDGDEDEAIALLKKVIAHKEPRYPGEWRKWDRPRAKELLKEWQ